MRTPIIIVAVIVGLIAAYAGYNYMKQPVPASERFDNAINEIGNGNLGEAAEKAGESTRGDQINNAVQDATSPSQSNQ